MHIKQSDNERKIKEPFQGLFTQGMVCHETYKNEEDKWLYPDEIEKNSEGFFVTKNNKQKIKQSN